MVQRYNPDYVMHAARFEPFARENEHGEFVKFSDYEVLKAERDALERQLSISEAKCKGYFSDAAAALVKCDALAVENARYSMSAGQADQRMAESRAVRATLGFNPDAEDVSPSDLVEAINQLTAELCVIRTAHPQPLGPAMDAAIDAFNAEEMPETGMLNAYFIMRDSIGVETPATSAALAAIQAQGVEKFADDLHKTAMAMCSVKPDNTAPGAYAGLARSFAKKLREAK